MAPDGRSRNVVDDFCAYSEFQLSVCILRVALLSCSLFELVDSRVEIVGWNVLVLCREATVDVLALHQCRVFLTGTVRRLNACVNWTHFTFLHLLTVNQFLDNDGVLVTFVLLLHSGVFIDLPRHKFLQFSTYCDRTCIVLTAPVVCVQLLLFLRFLCIFVANTRVESSDAGEWLSADAVRMFYCDSCSVISTMRTSWTDCYPCS